MKKIYENPIAMIALVEGKDVLTASGFEHRASGSGDIADWTKM